MIEDSTGCVRYDFLARSNAINHDCCFAIAKRLTVVESGLYSSIVIL